MGHFLVHFLGYSLNSVAGIQLLERLSQELYLSVFKRNFCTKITTTAHFERWSRYAVNSGQRPGVSFLI